MVIENIEKGEPRLEKLFSKKADENKITNFAGSRNKNAHDKMYITDEAFSDYYFHLINHPVLHLINHPVLHLINHTFPKRNLLCLRESGHKSYHISKTLAISGMKTPIWLLTM